MRYLIKMSLFALALAVAPVSKGIAESEEILTVSGKIAGGATARFTLSDLESLGTSAVSTSTPWDDGVVRFEGVPMARLMEELGATGTNAFVLALNNYGAEIPLSDFSEFPVILAYKKNGNYMDISDKGPLFIAYPFDDIPNLNSDLYYTRSVWQVKSIEIY